MSVIRINEARGLGILLVIAFHAIGSEPTLTNSLIRHLSDSLIFVRMPLFITISGFLMGGRVINLPIEVLVRKKLSRLLIPFVLVTLVCTSVDRLAHREVSLAHALLFGSWHLWYIQVFALLTIFYIPFAAVCRPSRNTVLAMAITGFALSASQTFAGIGILSFAKTIWLAPFFMTGVWMGSKPAILERRGTRAMIYFIGLAAAVAQQLGLHGYDPQWSATSLVASAIGVSAALAILRHTPRLPGLATLGSYSFPIYLWHLPLFALVSGLLLKRMHIDAEAAVAIRMVVGLLMPVVMLEFARAWTPLPLIWIGDGGPRQQAQRVFGATLSS